ncbi:MAG: 2-C-methyl-D-erythritol 4-phosphate cytidylyltransferase, partial [Deltaproteobacteria bacterium]|nr:2-C-methyl-D-erythritol 4-phosphate cytidylyltransferase [Deltaproteobacteria bacterium]
KQLLPLGAGTVLSETVSAFLNCPGVNEIIVVGPPSLDRDFLELASLPRTVKVVPGGQSRSESTRLGLSATNPQAMVVLVHDGVRPLIRPSEIDRVRLAAWEFGAAILAVPVSDTLKLADSDGTVIKTVDRKDLWQAQTPQGFRREILFKAFEEGKGLKVTDEASLVESMGLKVKLVQGSSENLKITSQSDLKMVRSLAGNSEIRRIGQGWDFHQFDPDRPLWLGCLLVPDQPGLKGHSDADVLAHAFIDALLGAAGLGDIGLHFPPDNPLWLGASGTELIKRTMELIRNEKFRLINADLTLIGEQPRISLYRSQMIEAMAQAAGLPASFLNLKGKTTEGLGFLGRREGLAATALVALA